MTETVPTTEAADGRVHAAGSCPEVDLAGHRLSFLALAEETGGRISAFEARNKPAAIADRHIHHDAVKLAYILEGGYRWHVGESSWDVGPGSLVVVPRHVAHHFEVGPDGARQLFIFAPAGMEEFFVEEADLIARDAVTDEALAELYRKYDVEAAPLQTPTTA